VGEVVCRWVVLFYFLLYWGYYSLLSIFERADAREAVLKIRVIKDSGRQITLFEALGADLLRVIDMLPSFYLVGVITMLCTESRSGWETWWLARLWCRAQ